MALSIADVNLIVPSRVFLNELDEWIATSLPQEKTCPWLARSWPGTDLTKIAFPTGFWSPPKPRVNVFRWPWGASRWSHGWFLASSNQVDEIQGKAFQLPEGVGESDNPPPGIPIPVILHMDSPGIRSVESVDTEVYVLAINPIGRVDPPDDQVGLQPVSGGANYVNGLYLITVVDERWFWWGMPSPPFKMSSTTKWDDLINACAGQVATIDDTDGEPLNFDFDIPSAAYKQPSPSWSEIQYDPLPIVFDAVLANCGLRLVKSYDGNFYGENANTANEDLMLDSENFPLRSVRAGGHRFDENL